MRETPHTHAVNYAFLRSLKQAEYSPEPLGHYALAAEHYCHFTSPIRRYPDLTIHRLVDRLVAHEKLPHPGFAELVVAGEHCSRTERRAEQAERELVKVKLLTYMSNRVGDEFEAIVTGVQDWGFFCQAIEVPAEGLVHISTLDDDQYDYDGVAHQLCGRRSGRQIRLGAKVRVVVAHVDVDRRQLDFRLAGSRSARSIRPGDPSSRPAAPAHSARGKPRAGTPAKATSQQPERNRNRPGKQRRRRRR